MAGHGLAGTLESEWSHVCRMQRHDDAAKLPELDADMTACMKLSFCVCQGSGQLAYWFHLNTVAFLKHMMVTPRKKKDCKEEKVEKTEMRVLCERVRLVLRFDPVEVDCDRAALNDEVSAHNPGWETVIENSVLQQQEREAAVQLLSRIRREREHAAIEDRDNQRSFPGDVQATDQVTPSTMWFAVGYCNYSTYHFSGLSLLFGQMLSDSRIELELPDEVLPAISWQFFKDLDLGCPWVMSYYKVIESPSVIAKCDMAPNRIHIERLQLAPKVQVWSGIIAEQERRKRKPAKQKSRRNKAPKAGGRGRGRGRCGGAHGHEEVDSERGALLDRDSAGADADENLMEQNLVDIPDEVSQPETDTNEADIFPDDFFSDLDEDVPDLQGAQNLEAGKADLAKALAVAVAMMMHLSKHRPVMTFQCLLHLYHRRTQIPQQGKGLLRLLKSSNHGAWLIHSVRLRVDHFISMNPLMLSKPTAKFMMEIAAFKGHAKAVKAIVEHGRGGPLAFCQHG